MKLTQKDVAAMAAQSPAAAGAMVGLSMHEDEIARLRTINAELVGALKEAVRIADDDRDQVFRGDLRLRETAIVRWKEQARAALAKAKERA